MEKQPTKCRLFSWLFAFLSWLVLNGLVIYLAYLVYQKGIGGELIIFIITSVITLDIGIIVAVLRSWGIKVRLKDKEKK